MTALKDYARLETTGLWRADADAHRREVGVSFGDATLVMSDGAGRPLAHWSLAAINRMNTGKRPALFTPDIDGSETLEIDDEDMIKAIEKVRKTIARARPRQGRLRGAILIGTLAALGYLGVFWLPQAVTTHTTAVLPAVKRAEIGDALLSRMSRIAGQPCVDSFGTVSLRRLQSSLLAEHSGELIVLPEGLATTTSLPGGHILIGRSVIEDYDDPSVLAGFIVAELARHKAADPVHKMLSSVGPMAAFQLLTRGSLPDAALDAYAEDLLTSEPAMVSSEIMLPIFRDLRVPTRPYALAIDLTGESTLSLIEADPFHGVSPVQHLDDNDWVSLQTICDQG